jgi:hypothetical protein
VLALATRRLDEQPALSFIRRYSNSPLALALVAKLEQAGPSPQRFAELARIWEALAEPDRRYEAPYEQARCLLNAGRKEEARALYVKAYEWALRQTLPPIDEDFRRALSEPGRDDDPWTGQLLRTAQTLIEQKNRRAVALLAWQAHELGDPALGDNLIDLALKDLKEDADRLPAVMACIQVLTNLHQEARADRLLTDLLDRQKFVGRADLWRLGVQLSDQRCQTDQAITRLEHALDLEYRNLPSVIDLEVWRSDYRRLLEYYQTKSKQGGGVSDQLVGRIIVAADRWRAHDPEGQTPCELAGSIFKTLGRNDLAWDYLTSPRALPRAPHPSLSSMAQELVQGGHHELADRAYAVAFEADPDNGLLLWERACNLRTWGKEAQAADIWRQLKADGRQSWKELRQRADWQLRHR